MFELPFVQGFEIGIWLFQGVNRLVKSRKDVFICLTSCCSYFLCQFVGTPLCFSCIETTLAVFERTSPGKIPGELKKMQEIQLKNSCRFLKLWSMKFPFELMCIHLKFALALKRMNQGNKSRGLPRVRLASQPV